MADKVRVVVGDDHPMFREGVVRALTSSGEIDVVAEADNGADALELIKTHRPQVALLDYRMPQLDGAQVAADSTLSDDGAFWGHWRVGGDSLNRWTPLPTSGYLAANIADERMAIGECAQALLQVVTYPARILLQLLVRDDVQHRQSHRA